MDYPSDPSFNLFNGKFNDGDDTQGINASHDPAEWANAVTDELLALVIAGGLTPNESNLTQVRDAVNVLINSAITALRASVPSAGDNLNKLYQLILARLTQAQGDNRYYTRTSVDSRIAAQVATRLTQDQANQIYQQLNDLVGMIVPFASPFTNSGFLPTNGAAVSRTTYSRLYSYAVNSGLIGSFFGNGNGSTTFNLPDIRGEHIRVWDDDRGVDSGRAAFSIQLDAVKRHTHDLIYRFASGNGDTDGGTDGRVIESTGVAQALENDGPAENRVRNIALPHFIKY